MGNLFEVYYSVKVLLERGNPNGNQSKSTAKKLELPILM